MTARRVLLIPDEPGNKRTTEESTHEEFSPVDVLVVEAERTHVWVEEAHYVSVGTVDSVEVGDILYEPGDVYSMELLEYVFEITDKYESKTGCTLVDLEYIYPLGKEVTAVGESNVLYSSPLLLTETGYALLDSPEAARARQQ